MPWPQQEARTSNPSTLLRDVLIALEDLSFDTGGIWGRAPSVEVYNRTFAVLDRVRKTLGVTVARNYIPDETGGDLEGHSYAGDGITDECERCGRIRAEHPNETKPTLTMRDCPYCGADWIEESASVKATAPRICPHGAMSPDHCRICTPANEEAPHE